MAHMYAVDSRARLIPGATIQFGGDEATHAVKVSRLRAGERVLVSNGHGTIAQVEATDVSPSSVTAVVLTVNHHAPLTPEVWLVQALAKGGRDELALEAAVELGVSTVIPWQAERSVAVWRGDKKADGHQRWARIAHEAAKQSLQAYFPTVRPLHTGADLVVLAGEVSMVVLDPDAPKPLRDVARSLPDDRPIALVVGPEGGISDAEREELVQAGAATARLGPTVLRTSTAGPVGLAITLSARGMWDSLGKPESGFVD